MNRTAFLLRPWKLLAERHPKLCLAAILGLCFLLALTLALVRRPGCDEAWFALAGHTLATKGYMGTPFLETRGTGLTGLNHYTYWIMPLQPVSLAGWYKLFGFSLLATRMESILFGLLAVLAVYWLARRLIGSSSLALLAAGLTGIDYNFVRGASDGRMDMMCVSLGLCALAAYLGLLEKAPHGITILAASALGAMSLFTHPNGIVFVICLGWLVLTWHGGRLHWWRLAIGVAPFAVIAAGWGAYIAQAPEVFQAQWAYNSGGRLRPLWQWRELGQGFYHGLLVPFGFAGIWAGWLVRLKIVPLVVYAAGSAGALRLWLARRDRGLGTLLLFTGIAAFWLMAHRTSTSGAYSIVVIPFFCLLLACSLAAFPLDTAWRRRAVVAVLAAHALVQLAGVAARWRVNDYRHGYAAAAAYLREAAGPADRIMASAEFGFLIGFDPRLIDDTKLGYDTGEKPEFVVIEHAYAANLRAMAARSPGFARFMRNFYENYLLVFDQNHYQVYRRKCTPVGG